MNIQDTIADCRPEIRRIQSAIDEISSKLDDAEAFQKVLEEKDAEIERLKRKLGEMGT